MSFNPSTDGFTSTPDGGTVASGQGATEMFALISNMSSLALEINTGLKRSRGLSVCKWAFEMDLTEHSGRETVALKRKVLADLVTIRKNADPHYKPIGTIARALNS